MSSPRDFRFLKGYLPKEGEISKGYLYKKLRDLGSEAILDLLDTLFVEPYRREGWAEILRLALLDHRGLMDALGRERVESILEMGERTGRKGRFLLSSIPPKEMGTGGYIEEEEAPMEYIPLGERISMAKGFDMDRVCRLIPDPDPKVIRALLDNPRITEREVVRLTSRRPNAPEILEAVALHRRWNQRYRVRRAITLNPYTPPRIALILLTGLLRSDIDLIRRDSNLHPLLREIASGMVRD